MTLYGISWKLHGIQKHACFSFWAVLNPEMNPVRPNLNNYFHITALQPEGTVPRPFRAAFRLSQKSAAAKNSKFALDVDNRFMKPSWVRAHGLIFGKVQILWVCATAYRPLSSSRNRIWENKA